MERKDANPSPQQWEAHRLIITEMYIGRNKSLAILKEGMINDYGFHASDKMYRARFRQWGLSKKMNQARARANLIQNRTHGIQDLTGGSQAAEMKKTMTYLHRLPVEGKRQLLESLPCFVPTSPHRPLAAPGDVRYVEDCLRLLDLYVTGSSENNLWPRDAVMGFRNDDIVPSWSSSIMSSAWVLEEGKVGEAAKFMNKYLNQCPNQLRRQDPLIFAFIYTSVLFFAQQHSGTALSLLNAIYEVSERLPWAGAAHPLRLLLQTLRSLGPALMHSHANRILPAYIDMIHAALGAPYPIVQDMLSDTMWRLLEFNLASPDAVADMGQRMVSSAVAANKHQTSFFLNLQLGLAQAYLRAGRLVAAREAAVDVLADYHADVRKEGIRVNVNMTLARVSEAQGNHEEAISFARTAITESEKQYGEGSDWNVNALIFYRGVLEKAGRVDEVRRAVRNRDKAIGDLLRKAEGPAME